MDKLPDSEIVKALDSYKKDIGCAKCGFKDKYLFTVIENALDLINRLQAENERLKSKLEPQGFEEADPMDFCGVLCDFAEGLIEKAKAGAYKEFAERLKEKSYYPTLSNLKAVTVANIDNLLKELKGND